MGILPIKAGILPAFARTATFQTTSDSARTTRPGTSFQTVHFFIFYGRTCPDLPGHPAIFTYPSSSAHFHDFTFWCVLVCFTVFCCSTRQFLPGASRSADGSPAFSRPPVSNPNPSGSIRTIHVCKKCKFRKLTICHLPFAMALPHSRARRNACVAQAKRA
jgi:hypothetical protein